MSYARSPRAVCSTTIGTRCKARSFMLPSLGHSSADCRLVVLAETRQLRKRGGLLSDLRLSDDPVHYLIFQYRRLDLTHRVLVLQVGASHIVGIRIRRREDVQARLHAFAIHL